ncbi:MAG: hypothetical protein R3Y36_04655 [Spirochaetales bacterium]
MTLSEMAKALQLQTIFDDYKDVTIQTAYTGDLLSDVMGNADEECVFITIQAHKNSIAVATLKDSPAIILCNDRLPAEDMIQSAKDEGIALFTTAENQFTVSGKLYALLKS